MSEAIKRIERESLLINTNLYNFIEEEALPETGISSSSFWQGFANIINDLSKVNVDLLNERDNFQAQIDKWHQENFAGQFNFNRYNS